MVCDSFRRFWRNESGATAIEYGLIAGLIAVGIIAAMTVLGGGVQTLFGTTDSGASAVLLNATSKL